MKRVHYWALVGLLSAMSIDCASGCARADEVQHEGLENASTVTGQAEQLAMFAREVLKQHCPTWPEEQVARIAGTLSETLEKGLQAPLQPHLMKELQQDLEELIKSWSEDRFQPGTDFDLMLAGLQWQLTAFASWAIQPDHRAEVRAQIEAFFTDMDHCLETTWGKELSLNARSTLDRVREEIIRAIQNILWPGLKVPLTDEIITGCRTSFQQNVAQALTEIESLPVLDRGRKAGEALEPILERVVLNKFLYFGAPPISEEMQAVAKRWEEEQQKQQVTEFEQQLQRSVLEGMAHPGLESREWLLTIFLSSAEMLMLGQYRMDFYTLIH
jgi:hypothetical protein